MFNLQKSKYHTKKIRTIFQLIILFTTVTGYSQNYSTSQSNAPVMKIVKTGIESGAYMADGETPCLVIHTKLIAEKLSGKNCLLCAYFYSENGSKLNDNNGKYKSSDGTVSASTDFYPKYDKATFHDLQIKIPVSELHLSLEKTYNLKVSIKAFVKNNGGNYQQLSNGNEISFTLYYYGIGINNKVYGSIRECSNYAFGKRSGICFFQDNSYSISKDGYLVLDFHKVNNQDVVSVDNSNYYVYIRDDNNYYFYQQAVRTEQKTPTKYTYNSFWGNIPTEYETSVSFNSISDGNLLKVAKDGDIIIFESPNRNTASLSLKEISYKKAKSIPSASVYIPFKNTTTNQQNINNNSSNKSGSSSKASNNSRYGYIDCHLCHGSGICQTCGGDGLADNPYSSGYSKCVNCCTSNVGKCNKCLGTGKVYGLK